jgi:hypothetical protein
MAEHGSLTQEQEAKFLFFVCWNKHIAVTQKTFQAYLSQ